MNYIYIGQIVNTHGIKGEIRIISDFKLKNQVFNKGFKIYIGKNKEEKIINTYRVHKNYDMVTLNGITDINDVLIYKGENVYVNRNDLKIDTYLNEDLIGLEVVEKEKKVGVVEKITKTVAQELIIIKNGEKRYMIPFVDAFIKKVDLTNKKIEVELIEGLIDEN